MKKTGRERMNFLRCERGANLRGWATAAFVAAALLSASSQEQRRNAASSNSAPDQGAAGDRLLAAPIQSGAPAVLPANVIVAKLVATSAHRSSQLRGYRATRDYNLQYRGLLGTREASMQV